MAKDTQPGDPAKDPFVEQSKRFDPNDGHMTKLKGKDYLPVAPRIVWFREDHGIDTGWAVQTEIVAGGLEAKHATVKASVVDPSGRVIATGFKTEDKSGFADFVEKAETGAIGRALGLCGFGTLQAQEFEEGDRVCDAPRESRRSRGEDSDNDSPKCSDCKKSIPVGRAKFCEAKKRPILCVACDE